MIKNILFSFNILSLINCIISQNVDPNEKIYSPVINLDESNFDPIILEHRHDEGWFLIFIETNCQECDKYELLWNQLAELLEGKINVGSINRYLLVYTID